MNIITANMRFLAITITSSVIRPNNTTNYTAGDVISAVTTDLHNSFPLAVNPEVFTGSIVSARVSSNENVATKPDLELWLFREDIAEVADNAAFAVTDTEMKTLIGVIDFPVADWKVGGTNSVCEARGLDLTFLSDIFNQDRTIYGQLVVRNAYEPIADEEFTVQLDIHRN